jgi:limonene-1,2-epoxide hydrolase
LDFPFVGVFRVEGGKIGSIRLYYDQIEVFTQLGLMPGATGG